MGKFTITFGTRLRHLRESAGLTQEELERRAGLPTTSVSQFERGRRVPRFHNLQALANALGLGLDAFDRCAGRA